MQQAPASSRFASMLGLSSAALAAIGAGGATLGVLPPFGGFLLVVLGLGLGLVGTVLGVAGFVASSRAGSDEGRRQALRGLALGGAVVAVIALQASKAGGLPRINDITTSVDDPPAFVAALREAPNVGRDMSYPGAEFAAQQQQAYPYLASMVLDDDPPVVFERIHEVLQKMPRMRILEENLAEGRIEASETSSLFRFVDDVVVRIRPYQDGGSIVDIRSKSRDGKGDMGVNAARIRTIIERVHRTAPESLE